MKKHTLKNVFCSIVIIISIIGLIGSLIYVINSAVIEPKVTYEKYNDIRDVYNVAMNDNAEKTEDIQISNDVEDKKEPNEDTSQAAEEKSEEKSDGITKLNVAYPDIIGWIKLDGTIIDYPVLYRENDNKYYLKHNYDGQYHKYGSIYLNGYNSVDDRSLVIFGHNINNNYNCMFKELTKFEKKSFFDNNKTLYLDIGNSSTEWEIIGVAVNKLDKDKNIFMKTDFQDEDEFQKYVENIKDNCLYTRDFEISENEQLVCLTTCSYHSNNCRTIVFAKRTY